MNLLDALCGPLATLECRRAAQPRWVPAVRLLAALPAAGIVLVVVWTWKLLGQFDPAFLPGDLLRGGLSAIAMIELFLALLLGPALVAGAIAGEKDRGTLGMLLASRLTSRELVLGRWAGCAAQVGMLLAGGWPPLWVLAVVCGIDVARTSLIVALPAAVVLGSVGLTLAVSTIARRGRDALWTVYFVEVALLAAASLGAGTWYWPEELAYFNPFAAVWPLVDQDEWLPATMSCMLWSGLGCGGILVAVWQLRPAFRRQMGGAGRSRFAARERAKLREDRPMLWKEVSFERGASFGWFGRWSIRLLTLLLAGAGGTLCAALAWQLATGALDLPRWCYRLAATISFTSLPLVWLPQWMIGLRAVGSIASERQQATWDAILASPLEAREIAWAKAWGSVYSLRWLLAALVLAWTAALPTGAIDPASYYYRLVLLVAGGSFMLAAGLYLGISRNTAGSTRSMAALIGLWMAAATASAVLAWLISLVLTLVVRLIWLSILLATSPGEMQIALQGMSHGAFIALYSSVRAALYFLTAALLASWLAAQFDRLAGRMGSWSVGQRVRSSLAALLALHGDTRPATTDDAPSASRPPAEA